MIDRKPPESGYSNVDRANDPTTYIRRLDDVAAHGFWRAVKQRTFTLLDLRHGDSVLDVGCGTGDDVRGLGHLVAPTGRAVGADVSGIMVEEARRRAKGSGLPVEFHQGSAEQLDFPDESFTACRAERLLQHLHDPHCAFMEMVRVTRPGGRIVVVEPDYGTELITGADPATTQTILHKRCLHFRSGKIGRQLPKYFRDMKATEVVVTLLTLEGADVSEETEQRILHKYAAAAQEAGMISADKGTGWLADLQEAGNAGRFRHAITIFLVSGRKPL